MVRVAINGFGRIGRLLLRAGLEKNIDFAAINNSADTKALALLFKYDSAHGVFNGTVSYDKENIIVNGKKIKVLGERDPAKLPWKQMKIDIVAECTGAFTKNDAALAHIQSGAKKVLVSAPCKESKKCKTIVYGVNHKSYDPKKTHLVSSASCTTNCAAPILKIINDKLGIVRGYVSTIHAYTSTQKLVDGNDKDLRRARAAALNIIPTTTGSSDAIAEILPELKGKIDGVALRVPVITGSISDITVEVRKKISAQEVNKIFEKAAASEFNEIVQYNEDPIVSTDIITNPHSAIFDAPLTKVSGNLVKVFAWYDNEWGYSCRMIDTIIYMGEKL